MNLSGIAIRRPVFTTMVILFLMVLGIMGLSRLGTERFPDISFPVVVVNVAYPGASPSEVEQLVAKPLEDAVVSTNGLDRLRSDSREGLCTIVMFFKLDIDSKQSAIEVQQKISQMRFKLPQDVKEPAISRFDVGSTPVLTYTLSGGGRSLAETQKFAKDVVALLCTAAAAAGVVLVNRDAFHVELLAAFAGIIVVSYLANTLPRAIVRDFDDAGHYVLEDKHEVLVPAIRRFLDANPLAAGA